MYSKTSKTCRSCNRQFNASTDFLKSTSRWRVCTEENLWFNCACGSTLFLKKGDYPWYSMESQLSDKAASIFDQLKTRNHLPYIKNKIVILQEMLKNPDVDLNSVARELRNEPILAANVIDLAERLSGTDSDSRNHGKNKLTSAVVFIGQKSLEDMLLVAFLKSIEVKTVEFDSGKFWVESQLVAIVAEHLSIKYSLSQEPCDAYIGGFLCNIGKIVLAYYFPDQADIVQQEVNNPRSRLNWLESERLHSFHDHVVLGEIAAAFWGLPISVMQAIQFHHSSQNHTSGQLETLDVIALANQLAHWVMLKPEQIDDVLLKKLTKRFGLTDRDLEKMVKEMEPITLQFFTDP